MSLAKAVISGTVYRAPEMRFTSNDVPISAFAMNISETEETLVRVLAKGNLAKTVEETVQKGDRIAILSESILFSIINCETASNSIEGSLFPL